VAIDVGKNTAMVRACDFAWQVLVGPFAFEMNRGGVAKIIDRVTAALPARVGLIRVGIATAGQDHRPLTTPGALPERWQVVELNPGHVALTRPATSRPRDQDRPGRPRHHLRHDRGRPRLAGPPAQRGPDRVDRLGGAPPPSCRCAHRDQESTDHPGRSGLCRAGRCAGQRVGHQGRPGW
jgi:hypothetical protein